MDDPRTDPTQAQCLRDMARERLDEAARCPDPARRDTLLYQAMAMLAEARRLRTTLADTQATPHADPSDPLHLRRAEQP